MPDPDGFALTGKLTSLTSMYLCGWDDKLFFFFAFEMFKVLHLAFAKMKMCLA